jgi:mannose-1-phosphate guanylyltransferase / phosphomannomutase
VDEKMAENNLTGLKAVIVAGGKGSRARSMTGDDLPKALLPIAGKPVIFRQLDLLKRYGIREVAVMAGYLADILRDGISGYAEENGIKLTFFNEKKPLGSAGCFVPAQDFLSGDDFLVLYCDMMVEMNLPRLVHFHQKSNAVATVVAHPNDHPHESDLLELDADGRILTILPRKIRQSGYYRNNVPASVYCFSPEIFNYIETDSKQDFTNDILPRAIAVGAPIYAYITPEYLKDTGTVKRFRMIENDLEDGLVEKMNYSVRRPAVFFDRDGVLNREIPGRGILKPDDLELLPKAEQAVELVNRAGLLSVVVTNQPQVAKGFTSMEDLGRIHAKLETLLGYEHALLDRIYFCPHHPETGFDGEIPELKIKCECRKPKPGLILQAAEELPIDLKNSCLIGDTWRDMGAAHAAGIQAYGVETGYGCKNCADEYTPDKIFPDVLAAVKYFLNRG